MDERKIELQTQLINLAVELQDHVYYIKYYNSIPGEFASNARQITEGKAKAVQVEMRNVLELLRLMGN